MDELLMIAMLVVCMCVCSFAGVIFWFIKYKKGSSSSSSSSSSSTSSTTTTSSGTGDWKPAYATYYESYPACCKKAPNYSPTANKSECSDYSGCQYMGQFSGVSGRLSFDQVKVRNIVSFYDAANQSKGACAQKNKECPWWIQNAKNKKLAIKNPATGKVLEVEALDTCNDADTNSADCTKNAKMNGGTLIDIENFTATRFWGGKPRNGKILWRWV